MNDRAAARNPSCLNAFSSALTWGVALLCSFAPLRATAVLAPVATAPAVLVATPKPAAKPSEDAEFKALQAREADARRDMSRWLAETAAHDEHFDDKPQNVLSARMEHRLRLVCAAFAEFRARHPDHAPAEVLEQAFRADLTADLEAIRRWEEGRAEDSLSAAPWNELAHYLSHDGRLAEAFECFEKSLVVGPDEAVYYFDFATAMLLYRADAARLFKLTEQAVFDKVLILYRRGMRLEPESFARAAEYAQTFYLITPARRAEGLAAWHHAYSLATTEPDREEVRTHLARYAILAQHLNLARLYLDQVSDARLDTVKESLLRRISEAGKLEKSAPAAK